MRSDPNLDERNDEWCAAHPPPGDAEPFTQGLPHLIGQHLPIPGKEPTWPKTLVGDWERNPLAQAASWLEAHRHWRAEHIARIGFTDDAYRCPERLWAQRNFVQALVLVEDRGFYDPAQKTYTVDRYLDGIHERYGEIDSVLLWFGYPNLGIDDRSQFDHARDVPGGLLGLREAVHHFQRRAVRVFVPLLPWDDATRESGRTPWDAAVELAAAVGADGVHGDTYTGLPRAFHEAAERRNVALVLQPQLSLGHDEALTWNTQSWGKASEGRIPAVSKLKWLEPRHMINVEDRWARDRTSDLQYAFFNGLGYMCWENVWGVWNGLTPRDAQALRRIATIYRAFPQCFTSPEWAPYATTLQAGVFASQFPGDAEVVWTLINRNEYAVSEEQLAVFHRPGTRYWDLWQGIELEARVDAGIATLSMAIEAHGFGCVLATTNDASPSLSNVLQASSQWAQIPLQSLSSQWHALPQQMVEPSPTTRRSDCPSGMVAIPEAEFLFVVTGVEIEGNWSVGVDVQYPWENAARRSHRHRMRIPAFFIDRCPVTNAEFKLFVDATRYWPGDDHNFLRHWQDGAPIPGWEHRPVTWVSLEDARAYAAWAMKRLPREWEWQYAAQGSDGRRYPWGNQWRAGATPLAEHGPGAAPPPPVGSHPEGASPFGLLDLVGCVWQWTDEYFDAHTRAAILRGGSFFEPGSSHWYFPASKRLDQHAKYLLMSPGKDRSPTIGFRCVVDAA